MNFKELVKVTLTKEHLSPKRIKEIVHNTIPYIRHETRLHYLEKYLPNHEQNNCIFSFNWREKNLKIPVSFYLPDLNDYVQQEIWLKKSFYETPELFIFRKYIDASAIIADCGTNIGNHTIFFAKVIGVQKVYSFEPIPRTFAILKKNIEINNLKSKVVLENTALGQKKAQVSVISFNPKNWGGTTLGYCPPSENADVMPCISLDEYFINHKPLPTHLKIDVEGFESELLKGADELLTKQHPTIFIEIQKHNLEQVMSLLNKYGYICKEKLNGENYIYIYEPDFKA